MMDKGGFILRTVEWDDCDLLYEWANDKTVRENSFNPKPIEYKDHRNWFEEKFNSSDVYMFIFTVNHNDVGLIRLEKIELHSFLIHYSIAKEHRGNGYATELLKLIKEKFADSLLIGKVKPTNIASTKTFIKAGYIMKEEATIHVFYSDDRCN